MGLVVYNVAWAEAYLRTKWHIDPTSRFATIHMGREVGLCLLFFGGGELGPHLTQCGRGRGLYMHAKFHRDPSNRLARIRQRYRQDRQRSDSVGRTVLQTVAQ